MNAKELGDMPAFPLPVIKDDKGHPMVHAHPYNHGMTVRELLAGLAMAGMRTHSDLHAHDYVAKTGLGDADALLALLAKDTE